MKKIILALTLTATFGLAALPVVAVYRIVTGR